MEGEIGVKKLITSLTLISSLLMFCPRSSALRDSEILPCRQTTLVAVGFSCGLEPFQRE